MTQMTKQQLVFEIENLSNPYLAELHSFIKYLKYKQSHSYNFPRKERTRIPDMDPILEAIGMIDVAPFSEIIDDDLYTTL